MANYNADYLFAQIFKAFIYSFFILILFFTDNEEGVDLIDAIIFFLLRSVN